MKLLVVSLLLLCVCLRSPAQTTPAEKLDLHETRYYILKTDLATDDAREAGLRMTKMAEEYTRRTRDFSGDIHTRFPFYLVRDDQLYLKLGGVEGSAGLFNGQALVVHVPDGHVDARVWHVLQHEGFHQFADAVIGGQRPVWVNEGIAEYFGEALFSGDGFTTGIIPQWRLKRMRDEFRQRKFLSIDQMMQLSLDEWNSNLSIRNYDQGWSMVHFLIHGDGGRYRDAFGRFMIDLGHNRAWKDAWKDNFGDTTGFEDRWREYWTRLPDNPSASLYTKNTVATLTSFLARATAQKQTFANYEAFADAARAGKPSIAKAQWLPPSLLGSAIADADEMAKRGAKWTLSESKPSPKLICELKSGKRFVGQFKLRGDEIQFVSVDEPR